MTARVEACTEEDNPNLIPIVTPLAIGDTPRREETQGSIMEEGIRREERFIFRFSILVHNVHNVSVTTTWLIRHIQLSCLWAHM
jgi:hypothetical protein